MCDVLETVLVSVEMLADVAERFLMTGVAIMPPTTVRRTSFPRDSRARAVF
jgi:hypothetical protein